MAKARNVSIRFDEEKLEFFRSKNPSIQKQQKIVDYFLDKYWWEHHIDNPKPEMSLSEVVEKYSPEVKVEKIKVKHLKADESNSVVDTKPERLQGESALDYKIRIAGND